METSGTATDKGPNCRKTIRKTWNADSRKVRTFRPSLESRSVQNVGSVPSITNSPSAVAPRESERARSDPNEELSP